VPQVDVRETEKEFIVEADLPGFKKDQVNVSLEDDILTISAEKEHSEEENREGYHRVERRHGSFRRSFTMPDIVDRDKIKADSSDGVLTVHLPKVKEKQGSRIKNIKIR
jgi:HSP20 family protein